MFRVKSRFGLVLALGCLVGQSAFSFSLLGPSIGGDAYQIPTLFYNLPGDIGAPKQLGEGYRFNTRNMYYAVDANFLNYFGSNGLAAVDQAFAQFNNLSNVSSYSSDLSEWPLNASRVNHRAEAAGLLDLKSILMTDIIEQLGLAEPDRWTWVVRLRQGPPQGGTCPVNMLYDVTQRNYDPVTYQPSSYVNGTLYSYFITENCTGPNLADAVEVQVDPAAEPLTAISSAGSGAGLFYTGLTRDDVGGLRYLLATNRMYVEGVDTNTPSFLVDTNNSLSLLVTSNLADLISASVTNTGAQLAALFPGIQILHTNQLGFSNVVTTNITAFLTNNPFGPPGSTIIVFATNFVTNILPVFQYTFGNVITNVVSSNATVRILTTNITQNPFGGPGSLVTNVVTNTTSISKAGGEFFLIPANQCGFSIISTQLTTIVATTNPVAGTTNQGNVTFFTNHTLVVSIPNCITNTVALREGIEKIHFFRHDFDSMLSTTWTPVTNTYTITSVASNNVPVIQTFYRVVTRPDFLITAADVLQGIYTRTVPTRNTLNVGGGLSGPGTLGPVVILTVNKVGPIYQTPGPGVGVFFLPPLFPFPYGEFSQNLIFQWGSFDGTTNEPVAYPSGSSITSLENNVFLQIVVTGPLPAGKVNTPYSFQLTANGAQPPPYTWSIVTTPSFPGGLPDGLSISPSTGLISGTLTATGVFDFMVQVSDTTGRISQRNLAIEIDP